MADIIGVGDDDEKSTGLRKVVTVFQQKPATNQKAKRQNVGESRVCLGALRPVCPPPAICLKERLILCEGDDRSRPEDRFPGNVYPPPQGRRRRAETSGP